MSKPYILEPTESTIGLFIEVTHSIRYGDETHAPDAIIGVSPSDANKLIAAGVALRAPPMSSTTTSIPIEEQLPPGIDERVWRADPRLKVLGQLPSSFVKIADFEKDYPRNR
jgi:hypothetical protein